MSDKENVVFSQTVSAWVDLRREFSKQVLWLASLATVAVVALAGHAGEGMLGMLFAAAVFFVIALGSSMAGINLDIRVLSLNSDPHLKDRLTKYDCAIRVFCITACFCVFLGVVFTVLAVFCPPQG